MLLHPDDNAKIMRMINGGNREKPASCSIQLPEAGLEPARFQATRSYEGRIRRVCILVLQGWSLKQFIRVGTGGRT
jgi:hypothetical protein